MPNLHTKHIPTKHSIENFALFYPNQTIWELLDIFKIVVSFQDLSKCGKELKGFTFYMEGRFHIVIDLRLRAKVQQAVSWHEFGHIINDADNLIAGETYFDSQIDDDYETPIRLNRFINIEHFSDIIERNKKLIAGKINGIKITKLKEDIEFYKNILGEKQAELKNLLTNKD